MSWFSSLSSSTSLRSASEASESSRQLSRMASGGPTPTYNETFDKIKLADGAKAWVVMRDLKDTQDPLTDLFKRRRGTTENRPATHFAILLFDGFVYYILERNEDNLECAPVLDDMLNFRPGTDELIMNHTMQAVKVDMEVLKTFWAEALSMRYHVAVNNCKMFAFIFYEMCVGRSAYEHLPAAHYECNSDGGGRESFLAVLDKIMDILKIIDCDDSPGNFLHRFACFCEWVEGGTGTKSVRK